MKILLGFVLGITVFTSCLAFECSKCNPKLCEDPGSCQYGVTKDACNCCPTCFQGPGEYCGGPRNLFGICAKKFACVPITGEKKTLKPDMVGTCIEEP